MMTLDEAIKHAEEVANKKKREKQKWDKWLESDYDHRAVAERVSCKLCADEHRQLAEWLKELKQLRKQTSWIPTSERQPEENGNYIAFYRSGDETAAMEFVMVDHCNAGGDWLHEVNGKRLYKKVVAWMPLPKPYKEEM